MRQKYKRIMAGFLAVLTLLFFAVSNDAVVLAASKSSNLKFWNASVKDHGAITEFKSSHKGAVYYAMIDGHVAYCMNYGLDAKGGQLMNSASSATTSLSAKQEKLMAYCILWVRMPQGEFSK